MGSLSGGEKSQDTTYEAFHSRDVSVLLLDEPSNDITGRLHYWKKS